MCGGLVSGERSRQTFPVVLTTPIPGQEIVRQLLAGPRRVIHVLWIPFLTMAGFRYWFYLHAPSRSNGSISLVYDLLELAIYLPLIAWGTFYVGTRIRSPLWAIMTSLSAAAVVAVLPILVGWMFLTPTAQQAQLMTIRSGGHELEHPWYFAWSLDNVLALASPAKVIALNEAGAPGGHDPGRAGIARRYSVLVETALPPSRRPDAGAY